ncbi:MAG: ATP-binding protein, partial [Candidatus Methylomirabilaceae bacterium]
AVLYAMSRDLATRRKIDDLAAVASQHLRDVLDSQVAVFLPDPSGRLALQHTEELFFEFDPKEAGVVQWVHEHSQRAGLGSDTLPGAGALYWPLVGTQGSIGVLAIRPSQPGRLFDPEQLHLLETLANQMALAIERARLAKQSHQAQVQAETERLRNAILSSVSHDLRTPLATITGAASSLLDSPTETDPASRRELIQAISTEANRLDRLVRNLLDMTRLEAGAVQLRKEFHPLEEVVGAALTRLGSRLQGHQIRTEFPADLPLVLLDGVLIEQVMLNLLENAIKYAPPGSTIDLSATASEKEMLFEIADRGPGLPPGDEERIFDKFYRAGPAHEGGVGLGLTICRGIVDAHGGRIWAENRSGGGAVFRFTLPLEGTQPIVEPEQAEPHSAA